MRRRVATALLMATLLPATVPALERTPAGIVEAGIPQAPAAGATCEIFYYDPCNWLWALWTIEDPGTVLGVVFESCAPAAELEGVWVWQLEAVPAGWGYTGYISVYEADEQNSPVEPPLAREPYLQGDQWTYWPFSVAVPERFVVTIEYHGFLTGTVEPVTDYPQENGCIPYRPVPHSYYYGTVDEPLRPGSPFFWEPWGAMELPMQASLAVPTIIPQSSWSSIKTLYR